MRSAIAAVVVTLAIWGAACDTATPAPAVVVRDSAGVTILESTGATGFPAPMTVGEATFSVGLVEGEPEYLLHRVVGAMQLPNGEILVANGGSHELRFYDASGRFLRSEGREGEGPGEYRYMRALGRCREAGFVVFDLNWQMNAYDLQGRFIERSVLTAPDGISPYNVACDPQSRIVMLGWGQAMAQGPVIGFYQARDRLVLASTDGRIATDFGEWLVSERIGRATGSRPHPAGRATVFALHDRRVYVGSGERFEIGLYDLDGTLQSIVRRPAVSLATTSSVKSAHLELAVARAEPDRRPAVRDQVSSWEWPESLPAYTALIVDQEGVAWLRNFNIDSDAPEVWSLLDVHRGYAGDVTLAPGQTLLEPGADYLLVLQRDDLGVQSVLKLTLRRDDAS